jgi:hypothetical protein
MIELSEHDIDIIIKSVESSFNASKGIRNRDKQIQYITNYLRTLLESKSSGLMENVCHECLGTGYRG